MTCKEPTAIDSQSRLKANNVSGLKMPVCYSILKQVVIIFTTGLWNTSETFPALQIITDQSVMFNYCRNLVATKYMNIHSIPHREQIVDYKDQPVNNIYRNNRCLFGHAQNVCAQYRMYSSYSTQKTLKYVELLSLQSP
jgi:hypothetical protein